MVTAAAWGVFFLGILHCIVGLMRFRKTISIVVSEGIVGKFQGEDSRRLAFWFLIFGPLLMMGGHVAIMAAQQGNLAVLRIVGYYLLAGSVCGVVALPKSPFWALLILAPLLLAGGYQWIR